MGSTPRIILPGRLAVAQIEEQYAHDFVRVSRAVSD
jgi:hypothetical protein